MKTFSKIAAVIVVAAFLFTVSLERANSLPAGKTAASSTKVFKNLHPKIAVKKGVAANVSIYVAGITSADQILYAIFNDTVVATADWADLTDSTYFQAADSVRCGTATATGYLWVFYHQAN